MAMLKKGSKGDAVAKLQERLNKLKCKPVLKIDGDFGKNTTKAVKDFQAKAKFAKADGIVGPWTEAALAYGGALPQMPVKDFAGKSGEHARQQQFNAKYVHLIAELDHVSNRLDTLLGKHLPDARKMVKSNTALWAQIIKTSVEIETRQKNFDGILLKNPAAAAKIAKECKMYKVKHDAILAKLIKATKDVDDAVVSTIGVAKITGKQIEIAAKKIEKHFV